MRKMMAAALAGTMLLAATPAMAGTFLVEFGQNLPNPNGGGSLDVPKFRVTNTTPGSPTEPYLLSLAFNLDASSSYIISGISSFGDGNAPGGIDNQPTISSPTVVATGNKTATITYAPTAFDPGAFATFGVNFGPNTTDFRQVLFTGTNTLTGTFSDGTIGRVTFAGNTTSTTFTATSTAVAAVPEPATWAMMLVGFGMVAGTARYRRRSTSAVYA